jgi:glutathione synthase/RimK-type ligase-like ATP-grasp enzyme
MSNKVVVISPKCVAPSAKYLAANLDADYANPYKINHNDFSNYDLVINYGVTADIIGKRFLNPPAVVRNAVDKERTFTLLDGKCNTVEWTKKKSDAIQWVKDGHYVVARQTKSGHQGKGVIYTDSIDELINGSFELYTKFIYHKAELRVNVLKGKVVSILEKHEVPNEPDFKLVLIRDKSKYNVEKIIKAINNNLDLDMYGADILVSNNGKLYLLEVNSAPSLHGYTSLQFVYGLRKELTF